MRNWIIVALLVAPAPAFTQKVNVDSDRSAVVAQHDLYDARTKPLVWSVTGTDTLSDRPGRNTAKTNKAVAKMFEQYPPTQK
jgi:hypothetical protein